MNCPEAQDGPETDQPSDIALLSARIETLAEVQLEILAAVRDMQQVLRDAPPVSKSELRASTEDLYRNLEGLVATYTTLPLDRPLYPMRGWPVSPDFALWLILTTRTHEPQLVLETGSGVSTVIAAHALRQNGAGKIISLEHDESWCDISQKMILEHELDAWAQVIHSPLRDVEIDGKPWKWYDTAALAHVEGADMLVVDGPPGSIQPLSRYPALPLLREKLADNVVILLDDAARPDERQIVARWNREFGPFEVEQLTTEKGLTRMERSKK